MKVTKFVVFCAETGEVIQDLTGRVSRRKIATDNDLICLVAEKLAWTGTSTVEHHADGTVSTGAVHPNGRGYVIEAR